MSYEGGKGGCMAVDSRFGELRLVRSGSLRSKECL
jgi:hypothetical protein